MRTKSDNKSDLSTIIYRTVLGDASDKLSDMGKSADAIDMDAFNAEVGRRLAALRAANGFAKIRHFATDMGVDEDRYSKWEKGENTLPPYAAIAICKRYGVTTEWLYRGIPDGIVTGLWRKIDAEMARAA